MDKVYNPTEAPNYFEFGRFLDKQKKPEEWEEEARKEESDTLEIRKVLKEIYDNIIIVLKNYCDLKEEHYKIVSLWIIGTYFHDYFPTYSFLFFNAPKASGKTRLLKLIAHLSHNGCLLNSLNESVMFRTAKNSTLCFDEAERINSKEKSSLKELLHVAYKEGGVIKRMRKTAIKDNENYVVDSFEAYCPIAMANIWGMDEVLGDRCLNIILSKSNNPIYTSKMELFKFDEKIAHLKTLLYMLENKECMYMNDVYPKYINKGYIGWNKYLDSKNREFLNSLNPTSIHNTLYLHTTTSIHQFYNKISENNLTGRDLELFFPLFLLSWFTDLKVFEEILEISKEITANKIDNELVMSKDTALVDFVSRLEVGITDYVKVFTIAYREFLEEDSGKDSYITNEWFGRALKRNDLILKKQRMTKGMLVTLDVKKAKLKAYVLGLMPKPEEEQPKVTEEVVE